MSRRTRATVLAATALAAGCLAGPRHRRALEMPGVTTFGGADTAPTSSARALEVSDASTIELAQEAVSAGGEPASSAAEPASSGSAIAPFAPGTGPATTYGAIDGATCEAMLKRRGVPYVRVTTPVRGVDRPIRLAGKLHGVEFHSMLAPKARATSPYEILDCRLALALDDFAAELAAHDVVEAIHYSIYRPPPKNADLSKPKSQHEGAMAIDLAILVKRDGSKLSVLDDWHGGIGTRTCGPGAGPHPATKTALEIRSILCDAAQRRWFNVILTPNYNKPHKNHFHLEVTKGVKWFLLH